jgi:hypothetical protein
MCIAILNTKQTTLKKQLLKNCWENNGDGAGMLFINNDNKLETFKEMKSFDNFYDKYIDVRKNYGKRNIVLHFRISTHGKVNETNCHPFNISDKIGFVHNGMIYDVPTSADYSDTYMFNEEVLKNLKPGFEYNETILDMLETFIGSGSKLVFLNDDDDFFIVNETAGHWNLGCWFSNSSYKQVNDWVDFGGIKKKKNYAANIGSSSFNWSYQDKTGIGYTSNETYINSKHECTECNIKLRNDNEIDAGLCDWCLEDLMYQEESIGICDSCNKQDGGYNPDCGAHICAECTSIFAD